MENNRTELLRILVNSICNTLLLDKKVSIKIIFNAYNNILQYDKTRTFQFVPDEFTEFSVGRKV